MLTAKLKVINVQKYLARENISIKKKIVKYNVNLFIRQCEFDIDILFDEKQISFKVKEMAGNRLEPEEGAPPPILRRLLCLILFFGWGGGRQKRECSSSPFAHQKQRKISL